MITSLAALAAGEQVQLGPGDTLRVALTFKYKTGLATTITLWASLGLGLGRDIENFKEISLEVTLTPKTWEGYIDIPIPTSGKTNGTYWLLVEIKEMPGVYMKIDNAVVISGMPTGIGGIFDMIPALVMVMMLGMIMPMMEEK